MRLCNSLFNSLIEIKIRCIEIESGFKTFSYSFIAWVKLITGTQDVFLDIGMSNHDLFFYMLTGNEYDL
jgi:hypothetical protein